MAYSESSMEAHLQLYEIVLSAAKPMALRAAVLLKIPEIISIHSSQIPVCVEEITSYISISTAKPAHTDYLFRIMRLLASIGVFTEEIAADNGGPPQYKYGLPDLSKLLANNDAQQSSAPTVLVNNLKCVVDAYQHLHDSVIEGCQAFTKANGMNLFEYTSDNPEINRIFNEGMTAYTNPVMASVVKMYDGFKSSKSVVDVAGGVGTAISIIVAEHPHIHGINFDLTHVIRTAAPIHGVEHVEGNMFEQIPTANAVFMKEVEVPDDPQQILPCKEFIRTLQKVAQTVSSHLGNAELQAEQACFLPTSEDGKPAIGKMPDMVGVYVATGHGCRGILNAPATGESLDELIIDGQAKNVDLKPFDPPRFRRASKKIYVG